MNYAVAVLGFVLVFCVVYYWFPKYGGKTFFTGPVRTIDEILDESPEARVAVEQQIAKDMDGETSASTEKVSS